MVSTLAHEVSESATDPLLNAWYDDSDGMENADRCISEFGDFTTLENRSVWNVQWGDRLFYVQTNWVNAAGGSCLTPP
jgi:hypothetical protein